MVKHNFLEVSLYLLHLSQDDTPLAFNLLLTERTVLYNIYDKNLTYQLLLY